MYQYLKTRSWFIFSTSLVKLLRETYFIITPDETTDVFMEKQLGICVAYFEEKSVRRVIRFFDIVEVNDCTATGLYKAIKGSFEKKDSVKKHNWLLFGHN